MSEADLDAVTRAIALAEASTSAEIRVHLDHRCPGDPVARAIAVFERLGMHRTDGRNGVLVYAAIADGSSPSSATWRSTGGWGTRTGGRWWTG